MKTATNFMMGGRRIIIGLLVALSSGATALAQDAASKIDGRLKVALARAAEQKDAAALASSRDAMQDLFLTGDAAQIRALVERHGGRVNTVAGSVVTARVPAGAIMSIAGSASVRRVQGSSPMRRFNETAAASVDAVRVWTAPPAGQQPYTGRGVIVGIIDSGIDWTHPDFRNPDDTTRTRILRIWDQTDSLGDGAGTYDYGTEWTKEQIDAAVAAGDTAAVRHRDLIGHGTHVTGTAAGNGLATGHHRGMAYEADIAVVGLDWQKSTALVDAAAYLFELGRQLGRPVVINMSLGSVDAPRDGSDPVDIALDAMVRESAGRVVVVAAGNLGDAAGHWGAQLAQEETFSYVMHDPYGWSDPSSGLSIVMQAIVAKNDAASTMIAIGLDSLELDDEGRPTPHAVDSTAWMSIADLAAAEVPTPYPLLYRNDSLAGRAMIVATPEGETHYNVYVILTDFVDDDWMFQPLGYGVDFFRVKLKGSGTVHAWAAMGMPVDTGMYDGAKPARYATWDNGYSVTSPGTANTVLTVGASSNVAQFEDHSGSVVPYPNAGIPGELAVFSSVGPSFDGRVKPEIVAPGHGVISALAFNLVEMLRDQPESPVTKGGRHAIYSGTSMACPVTTGSVALYLERNPAASYQQVKEAIIGAARSDEQTSSFGPLPNPHWGYGKLDIYDAIYGATSGADDEQDARGLRLAQSTPNPATTTATISFEIDARQRVRLEIVDMTGVVRATLIDGSLDAGRHEARLDVAPLAPGVYTYRLTAGEATRSRRMVVR